MNLSPWATGGLLLLFCATLAVSIPVQKPQSQVGGWYFSRALDSLSSSFGSQQKESRTSRADDNTRSTILSLRVVNPIRDLFQRASKALSNVFLALREGFYGSTSGVAQQEPPETNAVAQGFSFGGSSPTTTLSPTTATQAPPRIVIKTTENTRKYQPVNPFKLTPEETIKKLESDRKNHYNNFYSLNEANPNDEKNFYENYETNEIEQQMIPQQNTLTVLQSLYNRLQERSGSWFG